MTKDIKRKQIIDDDDNVSGSVDDGDGESGSEFAPSPSSSPVPKAKAKAKAPRQGAKKKGTGGAGDADGGDGGVGAGEPAKKKSKKKEPPQEYGVDIAAVCQSTELAEKYNAMKNDDLKGFLKANRMHCAGNKATLVARCVDGELWGAMPTCPRCKVAKLKVAYQSLSGHEGQGNWTCRGTFDTDLAVMIRCYHEAEPGTVTRDRWRDITDPAPEPETGSSAAAAAVAVFAAGFKSMDRKAAAAELLRVAREMHFQMPSSEPDAKMACGTKLMATRNSETETWDGHAALEALREDHAPMTAQEHAGGPPAACEVNSALATCLDKLARLEKNAKGDAFKIRSYVGAAGAIRELTYEVESGKLCAKAGPKKVKGIGKGIGEKIDQFLETGTMTRITELEGATEAA